MLQNKENQDFVEITDHILAAVHNPDTGVCEQIPGVTAIDFMKNTISYIDLKTNDKKTITGNIVLFVDKEKLQTFLSDIPNASD